ncbi:MAG: hypothetical protein HOV97_06035 [Nonomuraea sp.]|nr:hypothetical protein [Nonomuraea sp.]
MPFKTPIGSRVVDAIAGLSTDLRAQTFDLVRYWPCVSGEADPPVLTNAQYSNAFCQPSILIGNGTTAVKSASWARVSRYAALGTDYALVVTGLWMVGVPRRRRTTRSGR